MCYRSFQTTKSSRTTGDKSTMIQYRYLCKTEVCDKMSIGYIGTFKHFCSSYSEDAQVLFISTFRSINNIPMCRKISVNYKLDKFERFRHESILSKPLIFGKSRPSSYIKDNEPTTQKRIYDADRMDIMWLDAFRKKCCIPIISVCLLVIFLYEIQILACLST